MTQSSMPRELAAREINTALPLRKIAEQLDRLPLSADTKALIMDLAHVTVRTGEFVLQIGRKILSVVFEILKRFPQTTFGVVVSVAVAMLIASIPLLGGVLAPFLGPLIVAFGLTKGAIADMSNAAWASRIGELEVRLGQLSAA